MTTQKEKIEKIKNLFDNWDVPRRYICIEDERTLVFTSINNVFTPVFFEYLLSVTVEYSVSDNKVYIFKEDIKSD